MRSLVFFGSAAMLLLACGPARPPIARQRTFAPEAPKCAERERLTAKALALVAKADAAPEDRTIDAPLVEAGIEVGLHERQHHGRDLYSERKVYVAMEPALARAIGRNPECIVARDAARVQLLYRDTLPALAAIQGPARACRSPIDVAAVCTSSNGSMSAADQERARAEIAATWPVAETATHRLSLLYGVKSCTSDRKQVGANLGFVPEDVKQAFLAKLAREDAEWERAHREREAREDRHRNAKDACASSCMKLYGASSARRGPDATVCDNLCGSDTQCRMKCDDGSVSCMARCEAL